MTITADQIKTKDHWVNAQLNRDITTVLKRGDKRRAVESFQISEAYKQNPAKAITENQKFLFADKELAEGVFEFKPTFLSSVWLMIKSLFGYNTSIDAKMSKQQVQEVVDAPNTEYPTVVKSYIRTRISTPSLAERILQFFSINVGPSRHFTAEEKAGYAKANNADYFVDSVTLVVRAAEEEEQKYKGDADGFDPALMSVTGMMANSNSNLTAGNLAAVGSIKEVTPYLLLKQQQATQQELDQRSVTGSNDREHHVVPPSTPSRMSVSSAG